MSRIFVISLIVVIMVVATVAGPYSQKVTVFEKTNKSGSAYAMEVKKCVNLNDWSGKVSSVDTHNGCVKLYPKDSCKGQFVYMAPGTAHHENLGALNFDKMAHSIGVC